MRRKLSSRIFLVLVVAAIIVIAGLGFTKLRPSDNIGKPREAESQQKPQSRNMSRVSEINISRQKQSTGLSVSRSDGHIVIIDPNTLVEVSRIPEEILIAFSWQMYPDEGIGSITATFVNEGLERLYVFVTIPEFGGATGNSVFNIIESDFQGENLRPIGNSAGTSVSVTFSPMGRSMGIFQHLDGGSAGCSFSQSVVIIDLNNGKHLTIRPPRERQHYTEENAIPYPESEVINAFIDSYKWSDEETIELDFYFTKCLYQISPRETWQFNLNKQEYTLIN